MKGKELTVLWVDDVRDPYKYFQEIERCRKKNKPISGAGLRNSTFYENNIFNNYDVTFKWVKNIDEFSSYIENNGIPQFISFDRDLTPKGWKESHKEDFPDGLACIKWLKNYCNKTNQEMPKCFVHSANKKHIPKMEAELGDRALCQTMGEKHKITEDDLKTMVKESVKRVLNEMKAQHISPFDFNEFKLTPNTFGSSEKSNVSHGYGIYVAIDPYSGGRYVKSALKTNRNSPNPIYYEVDIPDFNGHNYILMHGCIGEKEYNRINTIFKKTFGTNIELSETPASKRGGLLNGFNVMNCIEDTINHLAKEGKYDLGVDKKQFLGGVIPPKYSASKFLSEKCGYVGAMYNGRSDRMCAFIFNPSLIKIISKTPVKSIIGIEGFPSMKFDPQSQSRESEKERDAYKKMFNDSEFYKNKMNNYYSKYPKENPKNREHNPDYFDHML